jgi:sulfide dehydrogenase cytochrome subunit
LTDGAGGAIFPRRAAFDVPAARLEMITPTAAAAPKSARDANRGIDREDSVRFIPMMIAAAIGAVASPTPAQGTDPNLARDLAATCANCHGTNGVSVGGTESLAGASKADTARKMQEFKSGAKPGTIMPQLAKGYTDAQIELIAGWFAAQKPAK